MARLIRIKIKIMEKELLNRIEKIEKKYQNLRIAFVGILLVAGFWVINFSLKRGSSFELIRTKGIIVEDSMGRDRILIGSPIPYSKSRVRTDSVLVRKYWASKFKNQNQYMEWYKAYKSTADGIVVMNEKGFDIVQLGDKLSDANVGKRMFSASGILWNTQEGWERGGAGVNTAEDGKSQPTIGLDDESGEAMHLICLEDGSKGIVIGGENGSIRIGMAKKEGELFQNKTSFTGIKYFDNEGKLLWEQNMMLKE